MFEPEPGKAIAGITVGRELSEHFIELAPVDGGRGEFAVHSVGRFIAAHFREAEPRGVLDDFRMRTFGVDQVVDRGHERQSPSTAMFQAKRNGRSDSASWQAR